MNKILKNKVTLIVLTVILLTGLFIALRPDSSKQGTENSNTSTSKAAATRTFALNITESQVTGDTTMQVTQGDSVIINIESGLADEIHLHGYDKELEVRPGEKYQIKFTADQTGRFEIELHETEQVIAALEVQPKP